MDKEIIEELIKQAKETAESNFCCNDSNFTVGAALLTKDNIVYKGFNIENDGIQSICAERVAFAKALSEGAKEFQCIVVVSKPTTSKEFVKTTPCGYCRQFMRTYVDKDFKIYCYDDISKEVQEYTIDDLLPHSFEF